MIHRIKNLSLPAKVLLGAMALSGNLIAQDLDGAWGPFTNIEFSDTISSRLSRTVADSFDGEYAEGGMQDPDGGTASKLVSMFDFGASLGTRYSNNIFLQSDGGGSGEADWKHTMSLYFGLSNSDVVNRWSLRYSPKFNFYGINSDQDGVDHHFSGSYSRAFAKSNLSIGLKYLRSNGTDRFASGNIESGRTHFNLGYDYVLSGKTSLESEFSANLDDFKSDDFFNRLRYNARVAAMYQMTGKTNIGPYIGYEHVNSVDNPNQNAWSMGVAATYNALQKTTFSGSVGAQYRAFEGGTKESFGSPEFSLGASHSLTGKVSLNSSIYHNIRASYTDIGQSYKATGLSLGANYAMDDQWNFFGNLGYEYDDYFVVDDTTAGDPFDVNFLRFRLGGGYRFHNGLSLRSSLGWKINRSSQASREYDEASWNLSAAYTF